MIECVCSLQIKIKGVMILIFNCITGLLGDGLSVSHMLCMMYTIMLHRTKRSRFR